MIKKEQPSAFDRCFNRTARRIGKVNTVFEEVRIHILRGDMAGAHEAAFEFADQTERLTLLARVLPEYSGHPKAKARVEDAILKVFPIQIGFTEEGWFCLKFPALMPKKNRGSPAYISDPLYPAMARFWRGKQPIRYPDNVIIFRHVYHRDRPERQYRDHDNTELSMILDIVALYVMADDSPMRCRHYYCSASGDGDRTEVYVVPRTEFTEWLILENSMDGDGVPLYENKPEKGKKHM
ncbi:MAG: DUF6100 family protein [Peptococcaceae bacterium]|jgi:hypothetical protein|nr:DUF6100 family protein [Peptococcaceae bacterium]